MAEGAGGLSALSLPTDGAELRHGAAASILHELSDLFDAVGHQPGQRLAFLGSFAHHLEISGAIGRIAASCCGRAVRPVRAIAFDKSPQNNWVLGWHQDRTICVAGRVEMEGYGPWTVKQGLHHVAPPFEILARMMTLRVHLDAVDDTNAPLLMAPGSHRLGKIAEPDIAAVVARTGSVSCLADAGDIWVYSTPILHASEKALGDRRRRVLQIDYSADQLPSPLEWMGVR